MTTTVGFEEVEVGIFDEAGENIVKTFVWRDEDGGTVNMTITGLDKEVSEVYASNRRVWISKKGTGNVTNTFETFNPPSEELDELLGRKIDGKTSWAGENTNPPYVALIAKSEDVDGTPLYMALTKGMFGMNEITIGTRTAETNPPTNTTLTGTWQDRTIDGEGQTYGKHIGEEGYEDFRSIVFPGAPAGPEA